MGAAPVALAGRVVLGIRLCFQHQTPKQADVCLAFHYPAANQLRGDDLRWTAEERVGQGWEELGDELVADASQVEARAQTRSDTPYALTQSQNSGSKH